MSGLRHEKIDREAGVLRVPDLMS